MTQYALHFFRWVNGEKVVIKGASYTVASGWYDLPFLLRKLRALDTDAKALWYNGTTVRATWASTGTYIRCSGVVADILGASNLSYTATGAVPQCTWRPLAPSMTRNYGVGTAGKRMWDVDSKVSIDGTVWAHASAAVSNDTFRFSLVERADVINDTSAATYTPTWEEVWDPSQSIRFHLDYGDATTDLVHKASSVTSGWSNLEGYVVREPRTVDETLGLQFADQDTYYTFSIPVIGLGPDKPSF